jgi:diguanylate cyclase (GGDEF)-like protein
MPFISDKQFLKFKVRQKMLGHEVLMYQRIMEGMRKGLKFESFLKLIINTLRSGMGFKRAGIFLMEPDGKHIALAMGVDEHEHFEKGKSRFLVHPEKGNNGLSDLVNGYYKYFVTNRAEKRIKKNLNEEHLTILNNAAVPLQVSHGRVVGALAVDNLNINRPITKSDVATLLNYSTQVGLAIESFWNHEKILNQSVTDPMTGLFNRRFFERTLTQELGRCQRYKRCCSLILVDIDHFKKVNDTYGHGAGDEVIKQVACLLRDSVRSMDVMARIGGEEFAVLLPETPPQNLKVVVNRLLKMVREMKPQVKRMLTDKRRITISLGVSSYRRGSVKAAQMVKAADKSLYEAKRKGRNRKGSLRIISN